MLQQLGKYRVERLLGQGAMGTVYLAYDPDIERSVAIKILHSQFYQDSSNDVISRFRREAQAMARCQHPNIVTVYELGQYDGRDFIVMEFAEGEELRAVLDDGYQFSLEEAFLICRSLLSGLAVAHSQGIVHRDIKPANVILLDNGGVKLTDFGIAAVDNSELTQLGDMVGTPSYMAPEVFKGQTAGPKADLFSCAMVLLEIITGKRKTLDELYNSTHRMFLDDAFSVIDAKYQNPQELIALLNFVLNESPESRLDSARDFLDALQALPEVVEASDYQAPPEKSGLEIDPEKRSKIEQALTSYVGPIAKPIVNKLASETLSHQAALETLSTYITGSKDRENFMQEMKDILGAPSDQSEAVEHKTASETLEEQPKVDLEPIYKLLNFYLGPVGSLLFDRHISQGSMIPKALDEISLQIPDEVERAEFKDQVHKLLR